jgi:hypothetical protein
MTATPVTPEDADVCNTVDNRIGGPGGIWLEQGDDDPVEPDPPVCSATSAETAFETPVELTLSCTGDERVIAIAGGPSHGSLGAVDQETGKVTYTPAGAYSGSDTFTFEAANSGGTSVQATATIQVRAKENPGLGPGPGAKTPPPVKKPAVKRRKCPKKKKLKRGRCVKKKIKKRR